MDTLPHELLSKILLYLHPMDRLSCSLTCRRFAEAMTSSNLLHDIWLDIAGHEMEAAASVLVNSQRQYSKLLLYRADLSKIDIEFWIRIGANLRELELYKCRWQSSQVFYSVLRQCTKLESFKIVSFVVPIEHIDPPEDACVEELRDSLSHLRHLHLDFKLTADILDLLLGLMPNVTSIFLASLCGYDASPLGLYPLDFGQLPSILDSNRIVRTGADFSYGFWPHSITYFVEITSGTLQELSTGQQRLTESDYESIVNCTELRRLTLFTDDRRFNASHLRQLVSNSPNLEILELGNVSHLGEEGMAHLFELKKLRTLGLRLADYGTRIANKSLCRLGKISTLVELHLCGFNVDSRVFRSLGSLRNLRTLILDECEDPQCLEAICESLRRLTGLDLGRVGNLTDADGSKLRRLEDLRSLSFSIGHQFTDLTFAEGVGSRAMKYLDIRGSPLTDAGLMSIASHHGHLRILQLNLCKNITHVGIMGLLQNEPQLKELLVWDCESVRHKTLTALRDLCPRLR